MFKRVTSFVLAALVMLGGMSLPSLTVKAEGTEKTFTFAELTKAAEWGVTSEISADGVLDISFEGQYQSQFYNIPSEIGSTSITGVKFDVASGNEADLAFKLHTQEDFDSDNKEGTPVSYGNPEIIPTEGKEVLYFSIMSLNGGSTSAKIADVTFELTADVSDEPKTFTVEENLTHRVDNAFSSDGYSSDVMYDDAGQVVVDGIADSHEWNEEMLLADNGTDKLYMTADDKYLYVMANIPGKAEASVYNLQIYNEETKKGDIRHVVIRNSEKTGESMVIIVTNSATKLQKIFDITMKMRVFFHFLLILGQKVLAHFVLSPQ